MSAVYLTVPQVLAIDDWLEAIERIDEPLTDVLLTQLDDEVLVSYGPHFARFRDDGTIKEEDHEG